MLIFIHCLVLSLMLLLSSVGVSQAESLSKLSQNLNIDPTQISVSGLSSGAYMAVQLQVIYSKNIMGAGIIAGGPYRCAAGKYLRGWFDLSGMYAMLNVCMHANPISWWPRPKPDVEFSIRETERLAAENLIDDPSHLSKHKVWMFSGAKDTLIPTTVMDTLQAYYQQFIPATNISYVKNANASHAMITENEGGSCKLSLPPFINDCDFDAAGTLLQQIYGNLKPKGAAQTANLSSFNQQEFFSASDKSISLHQNAHIYIPSVCESGQSCKLHIALHGCLQSEGLVGDAFYTKAGYNEWAEANNIVVLYPQAKVSLGNPQACWDWWGYSGEHYADKQGKQIRALASMLKQLKINF
ncbi:MAG: PHB depolymerase family esterase [Thiolinea sp.]